MLQEGHHIEYMPIASISDGSPIEFQVSRDSNYYLDLAASYIYLEVKITKADDSHLEDADNQVGPINLLGQSLFKQVNVHLGDTLISDPSNLYHYRTLFETLLSYSNDAKESQLTMPCSTKTKQVRWTRLIIPTQV